ncbi:hypothetical protein MMC26_001833 [Xylographa opegraphella]|nr:hypothetical protein [Xylographa opegraphella]
MAGSTYFSSFYPDSDYWKPLQDLKPSSNNTLTIIFVVSNHIYHEEASFDPIFPATEPRYFPEETKPYYYNSDPRARVLACADSTELCSPNGQTCWNMTAHLPQGVPDMPAYWFMKWSLENSNTYEAIKWRLGNALLAQESISQSVSKPLPSNQWEIEASQLFATSLARIQYDAWAIARGEDHELPGYVEVTPAEARGRLCRLYKFNSVGYTNVNLLGFIGLPLAAIVVWILSWEIKTPAMESGAAVGKTSSGHADTTAVTADDTTNGTTESTAEATTSGTITKTSPAAIPTTTASTRTGHSGHKNHDSGSMVIDIIAKFIGLKILDLIVGTYRCSARAGRALARLWKDRRKPWTNPQVEP